MTICANKECGRKVTRARFVEGIGWLCLDCAPQAQILGNKNVFPFTAFGISGGPKNVEVKSLRHLRQLEAKHGVQSVAFNQNESNFGDPPRGRKV